MNNRIWTIRVWDGYSTQEFQRYGTYEQIYMSMSGYPPAYIWSAQ